MKRSAYGTPIFLDPKNEVQILKKQEAFDEASIQDLIFNHPECLPISDIDESYNPMIPVCKELNTPVGPLDILMVTPNGELTIIETKLWRNPDARRVVVAQILDYAKELAKWTYDDLQREINRKLESKGNTLYEIAKSSNSNLLPGESEFVDSVSRNLRNGRFLLLIAGDGIKEGILGITEFLSSAGNLNFTFAMVELNVFRNDQIGTLVVPKTLVKTVEIPKISIDLPEGLTISNWDDNATDQSNANSKTSPEKERERAFYTAFWKELVSELVFDDPGQPLPTPGRAQNLYVYPGKNKKAWIGAYFAKSLNRVGVYFQVQNDQDGIDILNHLEGYKQGIQNELGPEVTWGNSHSMDVGIQLPCDNIFLPENREELKEFFNEWVNNLVNVFRSRMREE